MPSPRSRSRSRYVSPSPPRARAREGRSNFRSEARDNPRLVNHGRRDARSRVRFSPSVDHHRSKRPRHTSTPEYEQSDDFLKRRVSDLEQTLYASDQTINEYRNQVSDLDTQLANVLEGNQQYEQRIRELERQLCEADWAHKINARKVDHLKMQVESEAVLLRQFKDDNERVRCNAERDYCRLAASIGHLKEFAVQSSRIKTDFQLLRKEISTELVNFRGEYEEMQGQINALLDMGLISRELANSSMRTEGKIVVEQRHLKELLETILFHSKSVARDCQVVASYSYELDANTE